MLSGAQEAIAVAPIKEISVEEKALEGKPLKKGRQSKKAQKVLKEERLVKEPKRGDMSKAVLSLIQDSQEGISTAELKEKTGLVERQIWSIIAIAKKTGKIKQEKRGVYVGA